MREAKLKTNYWLSDSRLSFPSLASQPFSEGLPKFSSMSSSLSSSLTGQHCGPCWSHPQGRSQPEPSLLKRFSGRSSLGWLKFSENITYINVSMSQSCRKAKSLKCDATIFFHQVCVAHGWAPAAMRDGGNVQMERKFSSSTVLTLSQLLSNFSCKVKPPPQYLWLTFIFLIFFI